jgi:hypothetical protein
MKHAQPRGLSRRRIGQLLSQTRANNTAGDRIEALSRSFLGSPYKTNLIGSAGTPEVFVAYLDAFDCVTYVETVVALARSSSVDDFIECLRMIRYEDGRIAWDRRNHYMTGWIHNNLKEGILRRVTANGPVASKERMLNTVAGLPAKKIRFTCIPKTAIGRLKPHLRTGDLIFFASVRKHLDIFHCGIVIRDRDRTLLRHAARSRSGVVEQELSEFLDANRMAGVIAGRPTEAD